MLEVGLNGSPLNRLKGLLLNFDQIFGLGDKVKCPVNEELELAGRADQGQSKNKN